MRVEKKNTIGIDFPAIETILNLVYLTYICFAMIFFKCFYKNDYLFIF